MALSSLTGCRTQSGVSPPARTQDLVGVWDAISTDPPSTAAATYKFKSDGSIEMTAQGPTANGQVTSVSLGTWKLEDTKLTIHVVSTKFTIASRNPEVRNQFDKINAVLQSSLKQAPDNIGTLTWKGPDEAVLVTQSNRMVPKPAKFELKRKS